MRRWLSGLAVVAVSLSARAEPGLNAQLSCAPEPGPGRVLCELELEVQSGTLPWADVLVQKAPDFAPPLRARSPANERANPRRVRASLALGARAVGQGELVVLARYVHCPERGACVSGVRRVTAPVRVGTEVGAP